MLAHLPRCQSFPPIHPPLLLVHLCVLIDPEKIRRLLFDEILYRFLPGGRPRENRPLPRQSLTLAVIDRLLRPIPLGRWPSGSRQRNRPLHRRWFRGWAAGDVLWGGCCGLLFRRIRVRNWRGHLFAAGLVLSCRGRWCGRDIAGLLLLLLLLLGGSSPETTIKCLFAVRY